MKVAAYIRTSTKDQDGEGQRLALRQALAARGWLDVEWYEDIGQCSVRTRPQLERLTVDIMRGRARVVIVAELSRLGRNLADLVRRLGVWRGAGAELVCLKEALDCTNPAGRLMLHVFAALAEFERDRLRERTVEGVAAARAAGKRIGRPCCEVNAGRIVSQRDDEGLSWGELAKRHGVSEPTVRRAYARRRAELDGPPKPPPKPGP